MEKVILPAIFPGSLNLESLNQQIKEKTVQLDWSNVKKAQRGDLLKLLAGIKIEDPDFVENILGIDEEKIDSSVLDLLTSIVKPKYPTPHQLREEIQQAIYLDLLGPVNGEEEEVLDNNLLDRYLIGVLAPKIRQAQEQKEESIVQEDDEAIEVLGKIREDDSVEANVALSNTLFPASFGLTFCVEKKVKAIHIRASWGHYQREDSQIYFSQKGEPKKAWRRYPRQGTKRLSLEREIEEDWVINQQEDPQVYAQIKVRKSPKQEDWIVTIFLVNGQIEPAKQRATSWLFQPELTIHSADPKSPYAFIRKPLPQLPEMDSQTQQEIEHMKMLYRKQIEFAIGHGVSVKVAPAMNNKTDSISTCFIPSYEVPSSDFPTVEGLVLDMEQLSQATPSQLTAYLSLLPKAYQAWLEKQQKEIPNLEQYQAIGKKVLETCRKALIRLEEGIALLARDEQALSAFRLMNRSMAAQRLHSLYAEKKRRGYPCEISDFAEPKYRSWRLFQLAFILINLPSLTDVHHQERDICDLLWFATGGGKTEAYLGLTAYTLGIRRLQVGLGERDGEKGVGVLMRYTLRLLTLQQFQRATTLICALEEIRRENPTLWGDEPFRIGLWVGQNTTPNRTEQSEEYLKKNNSEQRSIGLGSPRQLTNCPWCGTKIEESRDIKIETYTKGRGRTLIYCGDPVGRCLFTPRNSPSEGIPVVVVDEEIYRLLPSLLISTVDKFARMPWQGEVQMLFGQVNGYCDRHGFRSPDLKDDNEHRKSGNLPAASTSFHRLLRPPDLIIQDELHLISGPLGTLVGLYETVVEELSSWQVEGKKARPKVIASTATIRQAEQQIKNLFNRELQIFPPQAIDIKDNFFSYQIEPSIEQPGRRYIGICAPGRRMKATMIRVYLAALAAGQQLYERYGVKVDPWMTLVGYFNSLRELGGTRRLVEDNIKTRLGRMSDRDLANRTIRKFDELTSRKDSTEIPLLLDQLELSFDPMQQAKKEEQKTKEKKTPVSLPLDIVLATNMISVGVDVKRLGLMVVCGQPKNTAEYIQATSRVGRSHPGLVITVYNWARPRDLSHYESFEHYHATFYQQVEALSVTPFAYGALDRGLAALFVSLVRLKGTELNSNLSADCVSREHPYIQAAISTILARAQATESEAVCTYIAQKLEELLAHWLEEAHHRPGGATLNYQRQGKPGTVIPLLEQAGQGEWKSFTCLNSLRNVEQTAKLIFIEEPPDDEPERRPQPMT